MKMGATMKNQVRKSFVLGVVFLGIGVLAIFAQDQPQKLTVKDPEASIYAKPDTASQVIEKPSVGSVYEIVRQFEDWYEIKLPSRLGIVITGYIQGKFVERPGEEPKPIPPPPSPKSKIGHISLGGLYHLIQMGYDSQYPWLIFNQNGTIKESVQNSPGPGFEVGLGFFALKNIEIAASLYYVSKTLDGTYGMEFPNRQIYSDIVFAEASATPKVEEMMFNFGLNVHFLKEGLIRPYLGAGISYINSNIDLLEDIVFKETFYTDKTHEIEITEVKFGKKTLNVLGFYGKVGIDLNIINAVAVYGEGQYLVASKDVPDPLTTKLSGHDELLKINLGGATALLGVKIRF